MGFMYADAKREVASKPKTRSAPRGHIPIESMNKLGCSVCPRDKDSTLRSPKTEADGVSNPTIYLLSSAPTAEEDERKEIWSGIAGRSILSKLSGTTIRRDVRMHNIVNCRPHDPNESKLDVREIECCRGRVVSDIEASKPIVVVGVGDEPLHWATGLNRNAMNFRGTLIPAKFGNHVCWYYPILYPNYTKGQQRSRKSEYELTMEHDLRYIEDELNNGLTFPVIQNGPYDAGIEMITGSEPGDMQKLEDAFQWLLTLKHLGMDYETSDIKPYANRDPKIWTAAVGSFDRTIAFPIDHPLGWGTESRMLKVRRMFGEFLMQSGRKRCHNLAFEQEWSAFFYGNRVLRRTEWEDTMAMAYALDAREGTKSLDVQCRIKFGFFLKDQSPVDVSVPGWINHHSLKAVLRYNGMDSKWDDKLADEQLAVLDQNPVLMDVYENLMRTTPTLVMITERGLPVNFEYAEKMVSDAAPRLAELESKVRATREVREYTSRFGTFSLTNSDHVLKLMKEVCKRDEIMVNNYDGTVKFSSGEEQLEMIPADEVPSAGMILEHRGLTRNESTYLLPLLQGKLTGVDSMIHAEYTQLKTVTSRLNSPMHNWPKRKYKEVRGVVQPDDGQWFLAVDQGQIEFRVAGMLSGDDNLVKYCWTGYDVHAYWAQRMVDEYPRIKDWIVQAFSVDWDEKGLKTLRQEAKNGWVFPQLFGSSTRSCAARLHLPEDIADDLGAEYWDEFKGVKQWQEETVRFYEKHLYVETLGGFRRRGPTTLQELINMPIQGTAYEIVREGMNALSERSDEEDDAELHPVFNGHDDLSFIVRDETLESKIQVIAHEMCMPRFDYVNVPLIVEVSIGSRWDNLKEIGKYSSADLFNLRNPYR